jgi:hypothetical protein
MCCSAPRASGEWVTSRHALEAATVLSASDQGIRANINGDVGNELQFQVFSTAGFDCVSRVRERRVVTKQNKQCGETQVGPISQLPDKVEWVTIQLASIYSMQPKQCPMLAYK